MSSSNVVDGVVDSQGHDGIERLLHLPVVLRIQHHPAGRVDGVRPEAGVESVVVVYLNFQTDEAKVNITFIIIFSSFLSGSNETF